MLCEVPVVGVADKWSESARPWEGEGGSYFAFVSALKPWFSNCPAFLSLFHPTHPPPAAITLVDLWGSNLEGVFGWM